MDPKDAWRHQVDEFHRRLDAVVTERMESTIAATPSVEPFPPPMTCHPAYTDREDMLQDWLSRRGPYADRNEMFLPPAMRRAHFVLDFETSPTEPSRPPVVLSRRLCTGPAPYVGRPFAYFWFAIKDEYARTVAGESWIEHQPA